MTLETAFLILLVGLGVVLITSGFAKFGSADTADELVQLGVPAILRHPLLMKAHPWGEILLGIGLLATSGGLLLATALASAALMGFYTVIVLRAVLTGRAQTCNCFGALFNPRLSWRSVARNMTLVLLSLVAAAGGLAGLSALAVVEDNPSALLAVLAACVLAALTWMIVTAPAAPEPEEGGDIGAPQERDEALDDYLRLPIPFAWLEAPDGTRATVREFAATRARMLVFLSTGCGACRLVAGQMPAWIEEFGFLGVHPVFSAQRQAVEQTYPELAPHALYESDREASRAFGVEGIPTAVLLGMDGLLAGGPVMGYPAIMDMVAAMREEFATAPEAH